MMFMVMKRRGVRRSRSISVSNEHMSISMQMYNVHDNNGNDAKFDDGPLPA